MQKAVLVGLNVNNDPGFEKSLREMAALAEAAEIEVTETLTQNLPARISGTLIGSGKIEEVREAVLAQEAELVLFDSTLSPVQMRNLNRLLETELLDRTGLILRIFSDRARTREASLQVESAKLQYLLPRLQGMHTELGRQAGTSGSMSSRGAGEKKIELDRRHIEHRIAELRRELAAVDGERETQRRRRMASGLPRIALVGYTNAGKSTILNRMLALYGSGEEKEVLEKDMLFATLDTAVRRIEPGKNAKPFLLSDTVGFISNLPTTLVKAFRSTLEEVKYADILLLVSDLSDPDFRENLEVTMNTLSEIGAGHLPRIFVFNKADLSPVPDLSSISIRGMTEEDGRIAISARSEEDIVRLTESIGEKINSGRAECSMLIPYTDGGVLARLMERYEVTETEYLPEGTKIRLFCTREDYLRYQKYLL